MPKSKKVSVSKACIVGHVLWFSALGSYPQNKKKALHPQRFFLNRTSSYSYSLQHYNFCEVGSGVTIVPAGSVVGAEHAATVRARTNPTTTFFIVYPFEIMGSCALNITGFALPSIKKSGT